MRVHVRSKTESALDRCYNTRYHFKSTRNNNNSYIALYPVNIYKLAALYIINIKNPLDNQKKKYKYYKCIHQYQNDKKSQKDDDFDDGKVESCARSSV